MTITSDPTSEPHGTNDVDVDDLDVESGTDLVLDDDTADVEISTAMSAPPRRSRGLDAAAGLIAAGSALGIAELFSGFTQRIPSLVISVGGFFVDETPGSIARWSIQQFGSNQKTILIWGVVVMSLIIGAIVGVVARRRSGVGLAAFTAFGLAGALAASRDPLASNWLAWLTAGVAALTGIAVLFLLLRALGRSRDMASTAVGTNDTRRNFVGLAGAAGVFALVTTGLGSLLRGRFSVEGARDEAAERLTAAAPEPAPAPAPNPAPVPAPVASEPAADTNAPAVAEETVEPVEAVEADVVPEPTEAPVVLTDFDDVDGISTIITPNEDFYRIDTALTSPQVDPANWDMRITGMVDNEIVLNYDDLLSRNLVEETVTLSCVSNEVGGRLVGNATWLGVPLRELLDEAGVQPGAEQIVGRSVDDWTGGFPISHLTDDPNRVALVALAMNGEPLPVDHGFPARLVIGGLYGYVSATKWLKEVELTTWDYDGYWIPRGWGKEGPIKTQSRIDVPNGNARVAMGTTAIAGVAWAPSRSIARVELRITPSDADEEAGEWFDADLGLEMTDHAWRQWKHAWEPPSPGQYRISVRATDGDGDTQTADISRPAPDGATGHHTIDVRVDA